MDTFKITTIEGIGVREEKALIGGIIIRGIIPTIGEIGIEIGMELGMINFLTTTGEIGMTGMIGIIEMIELKGVMVSKKSEALEGDKGPFQTHFQGLGQDLDQSQGQDQPLCQHHPVTQHHKNNLLEYHLFWTSMNL